MTEDLTKYKRMAAEAAVEHVQSGMIVGLGHGSTAIWAVRRLSDRVREGTLENILCVPCSKQVEADARELGLPLTTLDEHPVIDITIDGADEADPDLNVIKGGGGALLREKIVAQATRREIIVADYTKLSDKLGTIFALPVEVVPFGWTLQARFIESLGGQPQLRRTSADRSPFVTDQGNYILDCTFGPISDVHELARKLGERAGIVEHGLFLGLAADLIVAGPQGTEHRTRWLNA